MHIITHKNIYLMIAAVAVAASFVSVSWFGLNPSIDFSGGTVYEIAYNDNRPELASLERTVGEAFPGSVVQHTGESNTTIKVVEISDDQKVVLDEILLGYGSFEEVRFRQLGPAISGELVNKSLFAIALVMLLIVLFIAYTFAGVSRPVSSWKYGVVAIVALIHDTIIPIGIFAALGVWFINFQIDVLFVTALLATLGYSVNDTIVIFDRVRENLRIAHENKQAYRGKDFEKIIGRALLQSIRRSLFTSLTTLAVLVALFFIGGPTTAPFALVLAIGVIAGTYSSIFLACPLLIIIERSTKDTSDQGTELSELEDSSEENIPDDVKRFLAKRNK